MRKIVLLLFIATLASCNLFRKVKTEKVEIESTSQTGSKTNTMDIDTGNVQTNEQINFKWHMYDPNAIKKLNPPAYNPAAMPSADPSNIRDNMQAVQDQINAQFGYIGTLEGQISRFVNDQRGKSKEASTADTTSNKSSSIQEAKMKDPVIPWYYLVLGGVAVLVFWDLLKAGFTKFILRK